MNAITFEGVNVQLGEGQEQYQTLPCHYDPQLEGKPMIACFQLNEEELAEVAATGCIWNTQFTFGNPYHPVLLSTQKPIELDADVHRFPPVRIDEIHQINAVFPEGRLLMAALSMITTTPGYTDKTPEQVIDLLNDLAGKMFF